MSVAVIATLTVGCLMLAPIAVLIADADLGQLAALVGDPGWRRSMLETAMVALLAGAAAGPVGSLAAAARRSPSLLAMLILGLIVPPAVLAEPSATLVTAATLDQTIAGWIWVSLSPAVAVALLVRMAADTGGLRPVAATGAAMLTAGSTAWGMALVPAAAVGAVHPPLAALALEAVRQETLSPGGTAALAILLMLPPSCSAVAIGVLIARGRSKG